MRSSTCKVGRGHTEHTISYKWARVATFYMPASVCVCARLTDMLMYSSETNSYQLTVPKQRWKIASWKLKKAIHLRLILSWWMWLIVSLVLISFLAISGPHLRQKFKTTVYYFAKKGKKKSAIFTSADHTCAISFCFSTTCSITIRSSRCLKLSICNSYTSNIQHVNSYAPSH